MTALPQAFSADRKRRPSRTAAFQRYEYSDLARSLQDFYGIAPEAFDTMTCQEFLVVAEARLAETQGDPQRSYLDYLNRLRVSGPVVVSPGFVLNVMRSQVLSFTDFDTSQVLLKDWCQDLIRNLELADEDLRQRRRHST